MINNTNNYLKVPNQVQSKVVGTEITLEDNCGRKQTLVSIEQRESGTYECKFEDRKKQNIVYIDHTKGFVVGSDTDSKDNSNVSTPSHKRSKAYTPSKVNLDQMILTIQNDVKIKTVNK